MPDEPAFVSWASADPAASGPARRPGRLRRLAWRASWLDLALVIAGVLVLDFLTLFAATAAVHVRRCPVECGLASQATVLRDGFWVLPLVMAVPVLLALLLRKQRVAIATLQLALCAILLVQNADHLQRTEARLHGTAHCWNSLYSDADCPWGVRD